MTSPSTFAGRAACRAGFSLTELLVASAISVVVMGSVATLLGVFGRGLSQSQSTIDMSARMRATAWKLRQDLDGVTCPVVPWLAPDANAGYFELSEGPQRDTTLALGGGAATANLEADTDDILMFTTRAQGGVFSGRYADASRTIESPYAEVAWFCRQAGEQPVPGTTLYNLYRRQLLVVGYVGLPEFAGNSIAGPLPNIEYDISLRNENGRLYPNTLGDLTKRENRFMHNPATRPHAMRVDGNARLGDAADTGTFDNTDRVWEDVILTNVIGFDVRVYDPEAQARIANGVTLYPGDPGYGVGAAAPAVGAYIDLGGGVGGRLAQPPATKSGLARPTYDTWSQHYEFTAAGRSGLNDPLQYAYAPPYPVPLRGIEVRIRCYDPSSKQVRQISVRHTFAGP
jgi:prepilin-type N-terminal cleavage/methylation domain-containing protein